MILNDPTGYGLTNTAIVELRTYCAYSFVFTALSTSGDLSFATRGTFDMDDVSLFAV
jgi:hypothetical protein